MKQMKIRKLNSTAVLILFLVCSINLIAQVINPVNPDDVKTASAFRLLTDRAISGINPDFKRVKEMLQKDIKEYFLAGDPSLAEKLLNRLNKDSGAVRECRYIYNIRADFKFVESRYFRFYYPGESVPSKALMTYWDNEYERLSRLFKSRIAGKVIFIADPAEKFGRAFPPWEIFTGIRQKEIDHNTHELVHLFLFKYNDVPFFHEPLAFMYGTDAGDGAKMKERFAKYSAKLLPDKFVSSAALLHFPQIIGLDEIKWASAFCFVYKLEQKYGLDKLLELMNNNLWKDSTVNYKSSFQKVYGTSPEAFEKEANLSFNRK